MTAAGATPAGHREPADLLSPDRFAALSGLLEHHYGLYFDVSQRTALSAALRDRVRELGLARVDDYCDRIRTLDARARDAELRAAVNLVTVTETCFFRDPAQFRLLKEHILPALLAAYAGRPADAARTLRIWCAGCATGEEAYSVALLLWDMGLFLAYPDWTFHVVGTDLNARALEAAARGVYSARAVRGVSPEYLSRYFQKIGTTYRLNDEIRRRVRFEAGNLTKTPLRAPASAPQDVVFCKNVAIYFRPDAVRRLVASLAETLAEGGYLLLGHSELLPGVPRGLELVEYQGAFCYRRVTPPHPAVKAVERRRIAHPKAGPAVAVTAGPPVAAPQAVPAEGPAGLAVRDDEYERCLDVFRSGDWAGAETRLRVLVAAHPSFVPAHLLLGGVFAHHAQYDAAVAQAEQVLALDALEPRAHLLLGMVAARRGQRDDAVALLRRTLYLNDALVLAHFWLGNLYRDRGDRHRARLEYENVVRAWERGTLDLTEQYAADLTAAQLVAFCRASLQSLAPRE